MRAPLGSFDNALPAADRLNLLPAPVAEAVKEGGPGTAELIHVDTGTITQLADASMRSSPWCATKAVVSAMAGPGRISLPRRAPLPTRTQGTSATAGSTSNGQPAGRPTGVIPPYSMPVSPVANSRGANDALRLPRCLRTAPLTSTRWRERGPGRRRGWCRRRACRGREVAALPHAEIVPGLGLAP